MGRFTEYSTFYPAHVDRTVADLNRAADLHVHTTASDGTMSPEEAVNKGVEAGLKYIAITDHDTVTGAYVARNYASRRGLDKEIEVIGGIESSTADGHLLGIYMDDKIEPGQPVQDVIKRIHKAGGMAIAAHPGLPRCNSLSHEAVLNVLDLEDPDIYLNGVEIYNATAGMLKRFDPGYRIFHDSNTGARDLYTKYADHPKIGAAIGSSDAHSKSVGNAVTVFSDGTLREAIEQRNTGVLVARRSLYQDLRETANFAAIAVRWNIKVLSRRMIQT